MNLLIGSYDSDDEAPELKRPPDILHDGPVEQKQTVVPWNRSRHAVGV